MGIDGEQYIETILNKILKNKLFKNFEIIPSHNIIHSGDYLFMNRQNNICFMIECKNKTIISTKDDLNKFESDIKNIYVENYIKELTKKKDIIIIQNCYFMIIKTKSNHVMTF